LNPEQLKQEKGLQAVFVFPGRDLVSQIFQQLPQMRELVSSTQLDSCLQKQTWEQVPFHTFLECMHSFNFLSSNGDNSEIA